MMAFSLFNLLSGKHKSRSECECQYKVDDHALLELFFRIEIDRQA